MRHIDFESLYVQLDMLIYIVGHMNKGGTAIIYLNQVKTKAYAELVQLYKDNFETVQLYMPEMQNPFKYSGTFLIAKNFIGPVDYSKLFKLFVPDPPKFTISDKKVYDILVGPNKTYKYTFDPDGQSVESLNHPVHPDLMRYIHDYNRKQYILKYLACSEFENLKNMTLTDRNAFIAKQKEVQLVDAMLYCKKYDLDYTSYGSELLSKKLETKIISDMYAYDNPLSFTFKLDPSLQSNIPIKLQKLIILRNRMKIIHIIIGSRDENRWQLNKLSRSYNPMNKQFDLLKKLQDEFNIGASTREWVNIYEVVKYLHPTYVRTSVHLFDTTGDTVSALNHYIKTVADANLVWHATMPLVSSPTATNSLEKQYPDNIVSNNEQLIQLISAADLTIASCNNKLSRSDKLQTIVVGIAKILISISVGKSFVAKMYLPIYHPILVSLLYTIYSSFAKLVVYKSTVSQFSNDFFVIGKRFNRLDPGIKTKLQLIADGKFNKDDDLFDNNYSEQFMNQLVLVLGKMVNNYALTIDKQIFYVDNYEVLKGGDYTDLIAQKNKEWITQMKIAKIDKKYALLHS
jgi:hypothetical protein